MHSVDILKLKKRVIAKGLEWIVLDEEKVKAEFGNELADRIIDTLNNDTYES
jgi:hypothetical protein